MVLFGGTDDYVAGLLDAEVHYFVAVVGEDDVDEILSDVVDVTFTVARMMVPFCCEPVFFSILGSK